MSTAEWISQVFTHSARPSGTETMKTLHGRDHMTAGHVYFHAPNTFSELSIQKLGSRERAPRSQKELRVLSR